MDLQDQKAETQAVFNELAASADLPERAGVDFQFAPEADDADWDALTDAVEMLGHEIEWYEGDGPEDRWVEITVENCKVTFEAIWAHEERLTLLAAIHGFAPQGWGLFVPEKD
ncbi:ribonuclease E inhibitor RraB [Gemmobacter nectariphilus]|uniref:ribonuclease E inhibitor RraB n=1 Tax=Gemmobacter nectariphilus TaxID=220343 RepID=UPI0003FA11D9|nr:ribonuclease E inhibitor RraB [Gemmobacter nectariphilus]